MGFIIYLVTSQQKEKNVTFLEKIVSSNNKNNNTYFDNRSDVTFMHFFVSLAATDPHSDCYVFTNVNCVVIGV